MIPDHIVEDIRFGLTTKVIASKYSVHPRTVRKWKKRLGLGAGYPSSKDNPSSSQVNQPPSPSPEIFVIRPKIYRPREKEAPGQKQIQVLILSDCHAGAVTSSYDPDIFKSRVERLFNSLAGIRALQAKQHPLEELAIFNLGDNIQGENVGIQMSLDEYGSSAYSQVYKLWVPTMVDFITNLLGEYKHISWYGVRGNHGCFRERKLTSRDSNWDNVAQQALAMSLKGYSDVEFTIEPISFYQIATILGWRFMLLHGDVIKMHYTTPYYGIDRKTGDWEVLFHPDVFCLGHFHSPSWIRPRTTPIICGGTFKSDDEWSIGVIGKSGPPSQVTFGVHPERPVSWYYEIGLS